MTYIPGPVTMEDEMELARKVRELEARVRSAVARAGAVKRKHRAEMRRDAARRRAKVVSYADL